MSLGIKQEAQTAASVLAHNFPNSRWYKDAYALLQSDGLAPQSDQGSWITEGGEGNAEAVAQSGSLLRRNADGGRGLHGADWRAAVRLFLTVTQTPQKVTEFLTGLGIGSYGVLALIMLMMYLVLGCLMDAMAMIILTVPIIFPVIIHLGFDPIWFGVIIVMTVEPVSFIRRMA